MSKADIFLLLCCMAGAWNGYREGFLMELISLVAIILGVLGGFKLMGEGMLFLQDRFHADKATLPYVSFILIFVIIMIAVRLLGKMVKNSIDKSFLGTVDQSMGAGLGIFKTLFMASILIWIFDSLKVAPSTAWTEDSWLYPFTAHLAPRTADWIGNYIPVFREIFRQF
ncbi:MAG: CvpA family protein [Cyclobacteriaceae bacterium]|nr:CvpA family protein [Cyclobacteriaceae bacterium]